MGKGDGFEHAETKRLHDIASLVMRESAVSIHENVPEYNEDSQSVRAGSTGSMHKMRFHLRYIQDEYLCEATGKRVECALFLVCSRNGNSLSSRCQTRALHLDCCAGCHLLISESPQEGSGPGASAMMPRS